MQIERLELERQAFDARIEVPALVLDGGPASPLAPAAVQVARCIPGAHHQSLDGQPHNIDDAVMAAALTEFFG